MLQTTVNAIKGVVALDATMPPVAQRDFMTMVRGYRDGRSAPGAAAKACPQDKCISCREAAERLHCSETTVRRMRRNGRLTGVSLTGNRCHGVSEASLDALLAERAHGGTGEGGAE